MSSNAPLSPIENILPVPETTPVEILTELAKATTAYHEAPPDRLARARSEYEDALRKFHNWQPNLK